MPAIIPSALIILKSSKGNTNTTQYNVISNKIILNFILVNKIKKNGNMI